MKTGFILFISLFALGACQEVGSALKIVNGEPVADESDPVVRSTVQLYPVGCTATIIGPNQLSTAAHCLGGQGGPISRIKWGLNSEYVPGLSNFKEVAHEQYSGGGPGFDVAVITFDGKLPSQLGPVKVAATDSFQNGDPVTVAGYGSEIERQQNGDIRQGVPSRLNKVSTSIGQREQRNREFRSAPDSKGACHGDSGGPTYIKNDSGELEVIAATSRAGHSGRCAGGDGVYTDITMWQGWMKCKFAELGKPLEYLRKDGTEGNCRVEIKDAPAEGQGGGNGTPTPPSNPLYIHIFGSLAIPNMIVSAENATAIEYCQGTCSPGSGRQLRKAGQKGSRSIYMMDSPLVVLQPTDYTFHTTTSSGTQTSKIHFSRKSFFQ